MSVNYDGTLPAPFIAQAIKEFGGDFQYIWQIVAPMITSKVKEGTIGKRSREKIAGDGRSTRRAPGAPYDRDSLGLGGVEFNVKGYGKEVPVAKEHQALFAMLMDALIAGGEKVRNDIFVDLEILVKSMVFNTSTWTGAALFTDNKAAPWSTAGSPIVTQVNAAKEKVRLGTGMIANALIVSKESYDNMVYTNTELKGFLSGLAVPTEDAMKKVIESVLKLEVVVGDAVYNSAIEGQDFAGASIWPDTYASVARICKTSNPTEPGVARSVAWEAMGPGTDMATSIYPEPQTGSQVVQGDMYVDNIVVDPAYAHLMQIETA